MRDPIELEQIAKLKGQPKPKKDDRPLALSVDKARIDQLKALKDKERPPSNPLKKENLKLKKQLKEKQDKPPVPDTTPLVQKAIATLESKFRAMLKRNQGEREKGEADVKHSKDVVYRIGAKSALLDRQLVEAGNIKTEATTILNQAFRTQSQIEFDRKTLDDRQKDWEKRLPSIQREVAIWQTALADVESEYNGKKSKLGVAESNLQTAKLELSLVEIDTEEAVEKRNEMEGYKSEVADLKGEVNDLQESKAEKSLELSSAVASRDRVERNLDSLDAQQDDKRDELVKLDTSIDSAEDVLKGLQDASEDILKRSEKMIARAMSKQANIEQKAKGIIPALKAQIEVARDLQKSLKLEISVYQKKRELAIKSRDNYDRAIVAQIKSEREHTRRIGTYNSAVSQLKILITKYKSKFNEYASKIDLLEPMFLSITKAQEHLRKLIDYNKETAKAHTRERKYINERKIQQDIREEQLDDREQTLIAVKKEIDG